MLSHAQRVQLHALVFNKLGLDPTIPGVELLLGLGQAVHMPGGIPPFERAVWIVEQVLRDPTPERLIVLIARVDPFGTSQELAAVRQGLQARTIDWQFRQMSPLVVHDERPFVDRESVRGELTAMFAGLGPACLVVMGDTGEGKLYLLEWCKKLAAQSLGKLAPCEIKEPLASGFDPGMIVTALANALGLPTKTMPRKHEEPDRWADDLAHWFTEALVRRRALVVVAINGLQFVSIKEEVHTFVGKLLARQQNDPRVAEVLRVVLLGYDPGRLEKQKLIHVARVLEFVDVAMVRKWLEERYPGQPAYRYEDTAKEIIALVPPSGPTRMLWLCLQVQSIGPGVAEP